MGGSKTSVHQPTPAPAPSTADAISAWAKSMPQVYETQMKYAPLEAQQQLELMQKYAAPFGQAMYDAQAAMYPETAQLQEQLAGQATEGMSAGLTADERAQYFSDISGALGTNVGSPIGAEFTGRNLMNMQQQRQDYYRNLGLSVAGRQPLAQPSMAQTSNYMGGYTPGTNMDFMASGYGSYSQAARPFAVQGQQGPDWLGGAGSVLGGIGSMGAAGMFCWVAAELFGGWNTPKTTAARFYIACIGPKWFKNFYYKHGEKIAQLISNKPIFKLMLRPLFEYFAYRANSLMQGEVV